MDALRCFSIIVRFMFIFAGLPMQIVPLVIVDTKRRRKASIGTQHLASVMLPWTVINSLHSTSHRRRPNIGEMFSVPFSL